MNNTENSSTTCEYTLRYIIFVFHITLICWWRGWVGMETGHGDGRWLGDGGGLEMEGAF